MSKEKRLLQWEQMAKKLGLSLIPLDGKRPVEKDWTQYCTSRREFRPEDFEGRNAGIACGPASGILGLDVDDENEFERLCQENGWDMPETVVVKTGKGHHYYFRYPTDGLKYGNRSHKVKDEEGNNKTVFDIRGLGGQLVAPGSVHPDTGTEYTMERGGKMAAAPQWLLDLYKEEGGLQPSQGLPSELTTIDVDQLPIPVAKRELIKTGKPKGQRSEALFSVLLSMVANHCTEEEIFAVMQTQAIGQKYQEKGAHKDAWLTGEIQRAKIKVRAFSQQKKMNALIQGGTSCSNVDKEEKSRMDALFDYGKTLPAFQCKGIKYVKFVENGVQRTAPIRFDQFRAHLQTFYRQKFKKIPTKAELDNVIRALELEALESPHEDAFIRVGRSEESIFIDLADSMWRVVEINPKLPNGWQVVSPSPINFVRTVNMLPLPEPVPGGDINELRSLINCPGDHEWVILLAFLLSAISPDKPYPLLILQGEQGAAKSTFTKFLHNLVDPHVGQLRTLTSKVDDLMLGANNCWLLSFDNIAAVTNNLSDAFCRISTGAGYTKRQLYKDLEEIILQISRPVILNGINNEVRRADLADRSLFISLPSIPPRFRKLDKDLKSKYETARPRILGALYTVVASAMANLPKVQLTNPPRLADMARWCAAAEKGLGFPEGTFEAAFVENAQAGNMEIIESSIVAQAILEYVHKHGAWEGYLGPFHTELEKLPLVTDAIQKGEGWPGQANLLSREIKRIAPILRAMGLNVAGPTRDSKGSKVKIEMS